MTSEKLIFRCEICSNERVVVPAIVGKRVRCPVCNNFVVVNVKSPLGDDHHQARDGEQSMSNDFEDEQDIEQSQANSNAGRWRSDGDSDGEENPPQVENNAPSEREHELVQFTKKKTIESVEMDMTPMVDVTFLLLIFFMVTASFKMIKAIEQPAPTDDASTNVVVEDNDDFALVTIDETNTIRFTYGSTADVEIPSRQDLLTHLREAKSINPELSKATIKAHGECKHERLVMVMDAVADAQLKGEVSELKDE